ncbi:MAG TPA: winged helix-turn-helix domain-containing protein [Polyangiaceae bacterium]|nr:winged helix-turn-helix domain-containing protein [Polyangiaceae bacterium]
MAVPDFQSFMLPLLKLAGDGDTHTLPDVVEQLSQEFHLSPEDRAETNASGQTRVYNRVGWAVTYLKKAALLSNVRRGSFQVTERGRQVLAEPPPRLDVKFLKSRFSEMAEFRREHDDAPATFNVNEGAWTLRPAVEERIREKMERSLPNGTTRLDALRLFAVALENAAEERDDAWYVRETTTGLRLMAGGLLVCEVARKKVRLSVVGPIKEETRASLEADSEEDDEFRAIPSGTILTFPVERCGEVNEELKGSLNNFVDLAMARVRRKPDLEHHVPEAVAYLAKTVARELPQPEH